MNPQEIKDQALVQVQEIIRQNKLSKDDLLHAYDLSGSEPGDHIFRKKLGIIDILYYIGGGIVFLGIAIFIGQNWSTLSTFTKLLATLIAGIAAYSIGALTGKEEKFGGISSAFHLIAALVLPVGLYVCLDSLGGIDAAGSGSFSLISAAMLTLYLISYAVFRKNIFTLFSIIFGTWAFFSFTTFLIGGNPVFSDMKFFEYRGLVSGLSYILLGYTFSQDTRKALTGFLYGFGVVAFLGSAMALGGWSPEQNAFWEVIYPALVFGVIFLSVYLKSKSFLTFGSLFLMGYILKLTAEYFTDGLGWPLSLVLAGLVLIGVAYSALQFNKKYFA